MEAVGHSLVLASLAPGAFLAGLKVGQPLRDAVAICPTLSTEHRDHEAEKEFLAELRLWATGYSPWVAEEGEDGLVLDITGCSHLWGGETRMLQQIEANCKTYGLSLSAGLADTRGAAWALARFGQHKAGARHSGDDIDQEARATRSRSTRKQHWENAPVQDRACPETNYRIAPPGKIHGMIAPLPVAALRLEPAIVEEITRLGLRRIGDLIGQPRAALARRFGKAVALRLDQAFGTAPEALSPHQAEARLAIRLALPDPIGLLGDMVAALDRLLAKLCTRLEEEGSAARTLRLQLVSTDGAVQYLSATLARPSSDPDRIRPLLAMQFPELDIGFGIDMLRLEATQVEYQTRPEASHSTIGSGRSVDYSRTHALTDLIARIGVRIGVDMITLRHPADSHLPERSSLVFSAAWAESYGDWPVCRGVERPLLIWPPEFVTMQDRSLPGLVCHWRGSEHPILTATGPERIAREWWLDEAEWRSGTRDYWQVTIGACQRLWLFFAHGGALSAGWFCHGRFA